MKKIFLSMILCFSNFAFGENVIYKCTSSTGEITYQNNAGDKSECEKTNFASFPNINFFKQDSKPKATNTNKTVSSSNKNETNTSFVSEEQKVRNSKRLLILNQELLQEKEQLNTVSNMLKNLKDSKSQDTSQISQLEELKNSHINNINAIQREIGIPKSINSGELRIEKPINENTPTLNNKMVTTKANTINLPLSLPSDNNTEKKTKNNDVNIHKQTIKKTENIISPKKEIETNAITSPEKKEIKKTNKLGSPIIYSSGLSKMSKIKK